LWQLRIKVKRSIGTVLMLPFFCCLTEIDEA
jgi:hypothetical protein